NTSCQRNPSIVTMTTFFAAADVPDGAHEDATQPRPAKSNTRTMRMTRIIQRMSLNGSVHADAQVAAEPDADRVRRADGHEDGSGPRGAAPEANIDGED